MKKLLGRIEKRVKEQIRHVLLIGFLASFLLMLLSLASSVYYSWNYTFDMSPQGWSTAFKLFSVPIQCAIATIALLTLYISVYRMAISEVQMKNASEQIDESIAQGNLMRKQFDFVLTQRREEQTDKFRQSFLQFINFGKFSYFVSLYSENTGFSIQHFAHALYTCFLNREAKGLFHIYAKKYLSELKAIVWENRDNLAAQLESISNIHIIPNMNQIKIIVDTFSNDLAVMYGTSPNSQKLLQQIGIYYIITDFCNYLGVEFEYYPQFERDIRILCIDLQ